MSKSVPTYGEIKAALAYDPVTGVFSRIGGAKFTLSRYAGREPGYVSPIHGYRFIGVAGQEHRAHRLAYVLMTGAWPTLDVDHINGDRADNRWSNLRAIPKTGNQQNRVANRKNGSGICGVQWDAQRKKWSARITVNGNGLHLGRHETAEDARAAYLAAKAKYHSFQPVPRDVAACPQS